MLKIINYIIVITFWCVLVLQIFTVLACYSFLAVVEDSNIGTELN
jgi:hypothetical protein